MSTKKDNAENSAAPHFVMPDVDAPITDQVFADAYHQSDACHGEGWDDFAERIRREMEKWESIIREAREHIQTYDDGMAGWLDNTSKFQA